ncbi:L-threonylcarbamoyladenylate synthase [Mycoplasma sp. Ms02]|uniref:L-threonylcarbamoyladenylate synthase n=1 Tax=Mycoplasma sp. Ms02 TaxID=353851 RepID=UPI001C89BCF1|nr:Sua5/YciO/YrdC/YwlC family protein [Mycoplasma sp. Ms02]QZE12257.1 Sua5/YciO/YrdC/YwlC family protein [Mycoplasma sp. Ms02]
MQNRDIYIFTTDTVCGIATPVKGGSLDKIYELKQRPFEKKIMILVGSIDQARSFEQWTSGADKWALKFWPGAYSIVVNDQGFRMPNNQKLCEFLLEKGPMFATSANISGDNPIEIKDAKTTFPTVPQENIYDFGKGSGQASSIYIYDKDLWIRR